MQSMAPIQPPWVEKWKTFHVDSTLQHKVQKHLLWHSQLEWHCRISATYQVALEENLVGDYLYHFEKFYVRIGFYFADDFCGKNPVIWGTFFSPSEEDTAFQDFWYGVRKTSGIEQYDYILLCLWCIALSAHRTCVCTHVWMHALHGWVEEEGLAHCRIQSCGLSTPAFPMFAWPRW